MLCSQLRDLRGLVPILRSLAPQDAQRWFRANALRPAALHAPMIAAGFVAAVRAAEYSEARSERRYALVAAAGVTAHAAITATIHVPTNGRLLVGPRSSTEVKMLLRRWIRWHLLRTAALTVGEAAALAALAQHRE